MGKTKNHVQMSAKRSKEEAAKRRTEVGSSVFGALWEGIGNLIDIVVEMDEKGADEYAQKRTIRGKTKSGKEVRGEYGLRVRTGLDMIKEKELADEKKNEK